MAFLIINTGNVDGSVLLDKQWRVLKSGERLVEAASPLAWTHDIKVIEGGGNRVNQTRSPQSVPAKSPPVKGDTQGAASTSVPGSGTSEVTNG